jgi:NADH:ubiquinone oxidoreductase subunit D
MEESMEALIHHFKMVTEGVAVPAGEVYQPVESPRGELGYYVVSEGGHRPSRVMRPSADCARYSKGITADRSRPSG